MLLKYSFNPYCLHFRRGAKLVISCFIFMKISYEAGDNKKKILAWKISSFAEENWKITISKKLATYSKFHVTNSLCAREIAAFLRNRVNF